MKVELLISICSHRVVSAPTVHSLNKLRLHSQLPWDLALFIGDALISRARSQACSKLLTETDFPYMLFIDDDIIFEPSDVEKIYNSLKEGYDVIGGIYPVRGASQLSSYGWEGQLKIDTGIHDLEYLATGFMGISRRILEKVRDELKLPWLNPNDWAKCYPFFECGRFEKRAKGGDPIYISEDWDFCEKVRQVGGKIYADTSVQLGHMREQVYTAKDVINIQHQSMAKASMYGAHEHQLELIRSLDTDLAEFLSMPVSHVQKRMNESEAKLAKMWLSHKGASDIFYKDNTECLFDLAKFNRAPEYFHDRLGALANIKTLKVLDIGCGLGTTVFVMAEQGCETLGWDINQKCIDFCNYKKKKYELPGEFTIDKPDFSKYDLVIAVDVLEHINKLKDFLYILGKGMKHGAKLYHADYFKQDNRWPMHFNNHARYLSRWLKEAGFVEWDGMWSVKS